MYSTFLYMDNTWLVLYRWQVSRPQWTIHGFYSKSFSLILIFNWFLSAWHPIRWRLTNISLKHLHVFLQFNSRICEYNLLIIWERIINCSNCLYLLYNFLNLKVIFESVVIKKANKRRVVLDRSFDLWMLDWILLNALSEIATKGRDLFHIPKPTFSAFSDLQ